MWFLLFILIIVFDTMYCQFLMYACSSGSSLLGNNDRFKSSDGGHSSAFNFRNYAVPKPFSKEKNRGHKKKNSEASTSIGTDNTDLRKHTKSQQRHDIGSFDVLHSSSDFRRLYKKSEEVARVKSINATDLAEYNGDSNSTEPERGVGTKTNPLDDNTSNTNEGFCAVIWLHNGLIIDTTTTLKTTLGYTREEWFGRSFIEFVHPKDKATFADHLAKNIALPHGYDDNAPNGHQTNLFCCLRKHDDGRLGTGSGTDGNKSARTRASLYLPFRLMTGINYYREQSNNKKIHMMVLTITAQRLIHIYKTPEETIISTIFSTRHDSNFILTQVDELVVQYFGYLPQDMIGRSLFDFYHPEDLPLLKDIYETVVKMEGLPFRSKPYRFATQNGGYVVLETEWSSFINPWREKLEFVVGRHKILTGPANPDVFQQTDDCQRSLLSNISEEILKESKIIQAEIRALFDEPRIQRKDNIDEFQLSSRSKDLVTFVENLLQEVKPPALVFKDQTSSDTMRFSKTDGGISPYHNYCGGKTSSETSLSYHQLNYQEKMERFFKSNPVTTMVSPGGDEDNINSSGYSNENINNFSGPSSADNDKSNPNSTESKDTMPNDSGQSGSTEDLSSGSNNCTSSGSRDSGDNARSGNTIAPKDIKLSSLTETLLNKHNRNMEKLMAHQHQERSRSIKNKQILKDSRPKGVTKKSTEKCKNPSKNRAGKRRNSRSPQGKRSKITKNDEDVKTCTVTPVPSTASAPANTLSRNSSQPADSRGRMNIRHSAANIAPSQRLSHFCMPSENSGVQEASSCLALPPIIPVCYIPMPQVREDAVNSRAQPVMTQFQQNISGIPMATVVYPSIVCVPPQVSTMHRPFVTTATVPVHRETPESNFAVNHPENAADCKRPESQATSIMGHPGSIMAMSEISKKVMFEGENFSYCVSLDGECSTLHPNTKHETNTSSQFNTSLEDSSDSSFYGGFLSSSNASSCGPPVEPEVPQKPLWKPTIVEKDQRDSLRKGPPWQEGVEMTTELIYQYQIKPKPLSEVLGADSKLLESFTQPQMVTEQLAQLYSEMGFSGNDAKVLIEGISSNSDYSDDPFHIMSEPNREGCNCMTSVIYEEDAPLPSP